MMAHVHAEMQTRLSSGLPSTSSNHRKISWTWTCVSPEVVLYLTHLLHSGSGHTAAEGFPHVWDLEAGNLGKAPLYSPVLGS